MIAILLEYPANVDVTHYDLPLPENVSTNELCLLNFTNVVEYIKYVNSICDIIDELEYSSFYKHSQENMGKLKFCKWFINLLLKSEITFFPNTVKQ